MKKTSFVCALVASALLVGACGKKKDTAAPTPPPTETGSAGSGSDMTPGPGSGSGSSM